MTAIRKEFQFGEHKVVLETGEIARQADGAVMVNMGDTVVLCTVVVSKRRDGGSRLLSADRRLSGKDLCRRTDPGWFLPS